MRFNKKMTSDGSVFKPQSKKLLHQVSEVMRYYHYSKRSEESYVRWIKQFVLFNNKRHPSEMGQQEIERFLSHLAVNKKVAVATQSQALNAIVFLYKKVFLHVFQNAKK